jgi:hypothetical protein
MAAFVTFVHSGFKLDMNKFLHVTSKQRHSTPLDCESPQSRAFVYFVLSVNKTVLTFRNRASYTYIGRAHRYRPNTPFCIFFKQIYVRNF